MCAQISFMLLLFAAQLIEKVDLVLSDGFIRPTRGFSSNQLNSVRGKSRRGGCQGDSYKYKQFLLRAQKEPSRGKELAGKQVLLTWMENE